MPAEHTLIDVLSTLEDRKILATIARVIETTPYMSQFQVEEVPNGLSTFFSEGDLDEPDYEALEADITEATTEPDNPITTHTRKLARKLKLDPIKAKRETRGGPSYVEKEIRKLNRAFGLQWKLFSMQQDAASKPARPQGIYGWIDYWNNFFSGNKIAASTTGTTVASLGISAFQREMSKLIDAVYTPDFILSNRNIMNQVRNLVETGGVTEKFANKVDFDTVEMMPGRSTRVMTYEGIPWFPTDHAAKRTTLVNPFNEDPGDGGLDTSSIVAVRTGEEAFTLLFDDLGEPMMIEEYSQDSQKVIDLIMMNATEAREDRCLARLTGFLED